MNKMNISIQSRLSNESIIRTSAVAFFMPLNLSIETMMEIKTILAEAVVNAMIHGYDSKEDEMIDISFAYDEKQITMIVQDYGCGIKDIKQAMTPLYTSKEDQERSGMGMSIMDSFCDEFYVDSIVNKGSKITMIKYIQHERL